jgi:hypothetical protein
MGYNKYIMDKLRELLESLRIAEIKYLAERLGVYCVESYARAELLNMITEQLAAKAIESVKHILE